MPQKLQNKKKSQYTYFETCFYSGRFEIITQPASTALNEINIVNK